MRLSCNTLGGQYLHGMLVTTLWSAPIILKTKLEFIIHDKYLTQIIGWKKKKKGKRKVQGVPQSQTAALPRHQEEEETDKSKQAQIEQTYEKH